MKTRQFLRVPVPIPVKMRISDLDEEFKFSTIEDISWGGAFVIMKTPAPKGSRLVLQFQLSEDNVSMELWGTVVRQRERSDSGPAGVGVQFDSLDDDTRSLIQKLIEEEVTGLLGAATGN